MYKQFSFLNEELSAAGRHPSLAAVRLISFALWCPVPIWHGTGCSSAGGVIGRNAELMSSALRRAIAPWHGTECSCEGAVIGRHAAVDVVRSTARNRTLTRNCVQLCRTRHRSLFSNWCRPLYGAQSYLDTELSAAMQEPSSVIMQYCSYERSCRFCQRVPCSAGHSVARFKISKVTVKCCLVIEI